MKAKALEYEEADRKNRSEAKRAKKDKENRMNSEFMAVMNKTQVLWKAT